MRELLRAITILGISVHLTFTCLAADSTKTVSAAIPTVTPLMVSISEVNASTGVWTTEKTTANFGNLTFNTTYNIFQASVYYAIDVGIDSNADNWWITHTHATITDGEGNDLDGNINVTFMKQTGPSTATSLDAVSYGNSDKSYTKAEMAGGWLRVYYGMGTGSGDNTGVTPITISKPVGTYSGSVTFTLTEL